VSPVLRVDGVTKRYRGVTAVDGLSFTVERQQIMALLGPNGAGKTTTVRMIQGIVPPDEGRVTLDIPGATGAPRPGLGYLPEDRGLYKDQPIERILRFFGRLRGLSKGEARDATQSWLERFELADRRRDKLDTLSKGNQQKVQFASAVLHRPAFAVLDEPFSGLDPVNQDAFLELLSELRDEGMTILLSAHQMELVERIADRVLLMARGREVLSGDLDALRGEGGTERLHDLYVRTVTAADADAAAALDGTGPTDDPAPDDDPSPPIGPSAADGPGSPGGGSPEP
jgi:ABC-2 type transport system ATP-binding protein